MSVTSIRVRLEDPSGRTIYQDVKIAPHGRELKSVRIPIESGGLFRRSHGTVVVEFDPNLTE